MRDYNVCVSSFGYLGPFDHEGIQSLWKRFSWVYRRSFHRFWPLMVFFHVSSMGMDGIRERCWKWALSHRAAFSRHLDVRQPFEILWDSLLCCIIYIVINPCWLRPFHCFCDSYWGCIHLVELLSFFSFFSRCAI